MALTEIKTSGIADDAVTTDKLANAINTERAANTAKTSVGGATGVDFNDSVKARFGTDNDLEIFHTDTYGAIHNNKGGLYIRCNHDDDDGGDIHIQAKSGESSIVCRDDAQVELFFDNDRKFRTTGSGINVESTTGDTYLVIHAEEDDAQVDSFLRLLVTNTDATSGIHFGDAGDSDIGQILYEHSDNSMRFRTNTSEHWRITSDGNLQNNSDSGKLQFGVSEDLEIFHNGNHSIIADVGTGNLQIRADDFRVTDSTNAEVMIKADTNGSVELYYDHSKKLETISEGIKVSGAEGGNSVIQLYADEGDDNNDKYRLLAGDGTSFYLQNYASGSWETNIKATGDGAVELYNDNVKKLETTSDGIKISGGEGEEANITFFADEGDNATDKFRLRTSDSSGFFVENYANGSSWETNIKATGNGSVELYHNDTRRLETTSKGCIITGELRAHTEVGDSDWTSGDRHVIQQNDGSKSALVIEHSNDDSAFGFLVDFSDDAPDDHTHWFMSCDDSSTNRFKIWSDGDVRNHDNSYGSLSDIKLKENIVDANSQWNDVKAVKVRNFNFKDNKDKTLLGVVAQELETISPGLVDEDTDQDKYNNDLGTTTKSVKYSILYMKAFKALQEAMAKIETLETKVAALEAK